MATQPRQLVTFDEYLERERKADVKSEYYSGEVYVMAGGTAIHSRLSARMIAILDRLLRCEIYDSNLKLFVESVQECVYPDAMVVSGTAEFKDLRNDVLLNPTLVVEVLSPSTEAYDKGAKSLYYRTVPSLRHCLLISQDRIFVEHSERQEDRTWILTQYSDRNVRVPIKSMDVEISLSEIYEDIPVL